MFFACHFQEEHSSLDNKNYVESIFILYRIKYQKIKIDLTGGNIHIKGGNIHIKLVILISY